MPKLVETDISKTILKAYYEKLSARIISDVIIVGAGPSGMTGAYYLALKGLKVTILEKRLSPGGGIWGGGMGMNEIVVQNEVLPLLDEFGIRHRPGRGNLNTVDAIELAAGLCLKVIQSGVMLFNLMKVEDLCVHRERVTGVVVNRSMIAENIPVDPIILSAKAVVDATGHEAVVVETLLRRHMLAKSITDIPGEGPLDATSGEEFAVERVAEVYPGLWVTGMSVCATFGGPRMGPVFGGMLLSGMRAAELISSKLIESGKNTTEIPK